VDSHGGPSHIGVALMAWTDEQRDRAKALWQEGLSGREIARAIGGGKSRNAVIGLAHRQGWASRSTQPRTPLPPREPRPPRISARKELPVEPLKEPLLLDGQPVTILTLKLDRMCAFPIGDPTEPSFHFCANKQKRGSIYCDPHHSLTHQPMTEEQRRLRAPRPW
jgi:GcrA cell cycle regulator